MSTDRDEDVLKASNVVVRDMAPNKFAIGALKEENALNADANMRATTAMNRVVRPLLTNVIVEAVRKRDRRARLAIRHTARNVANRVVDFVTKQNDMADQSTLPIAVRIIVGAGTNSIDVTSTDFLRVDLDVTQVAITVDSSTLPILVHIIVAVVVNLNAVASTGVHRVDLAMTQVAITVDSST